MSWVRLRNVSVPTWLNQMSNCPVPIGQEHDELAVRRDVGKRFGAGEIGEACERRVLERIAPDAFGALRGQSAIANAATLQRPRRKRRRLASARTASRCCVAGASGAAGLLIVSSISIRASPMSRSRRFESFSRHRRSRPSMERGVAAGSAAQSGSRCRIDAIVSDTVSPRNATRPVSISNSTQPKAQMSVRLSTACRAPAPGSCTPPCRG